MKSEDCKSVNFVATVINMREYHDERRNYHSVKDLYEA